MPVVVISEAPGVTPDQDDAIQQRLNLAGDPPAGAIARFAGPTETGWRVLSVWESLEAWETFRRERLEPLIRQLGRTLPPVQTWPVHSVRIAPQAR